MFMYEDAWKTDSEFEHCVVNPKYVLKGSRVECRGGGRECFLAHFDRFPLEHPKTSGTALTGLKKRKFGWKRTSCLKFRVSPPADVC